jgi:hypothetical protein
MAKGAGFFRPRIVLQRKRFGQAIARLHHLSNAAVSTLGKVMLDPATPPASNVRAADSILERSILTPA